MRVLVCGGRDYNDRNTIFNTLDRIEADRGLFRVVIHGDASGADKLAGEWAYTRGIRTVAVPANWTKHKRAAGPIRNKLMIKDHKPDLVIAFPGQAGTLNMIGLANEHGIEVVKAGTWDE